ncbi:sensor histidine kinase [Sunxiuqinia sp. A32]|uniref:sensor histidine kinase n=1 Tax=Sunxiuqinia sp. A32 TaxID=3461496 RepID=UPI004046371F
MPQYKKQTEERINGMIDALLKVTQGNYDTQVQLSEENDLLDSLGLGINMLIDDIRHGLEIKSQNKQIIKENTELEVSLKKAEENERLKSAFLANMSHEIRTPLNSILGFSEILKPTLDLEKFYQYREIILNSGRQLMQVIDDILDVSKLESNQLMIFKEPCQIKAILDEQYELHQQNPHLGDNPDVHLKKPIVKKGYENLIIETDPIRLSQVLNNLINNAIKFTDEGFIEFGFNMDKKSSGFIQFFVKDTGYGIQQEKINSIFDRFVQAENHRMKEGNGLGLSICKGLMDLLGGEISVESQPGMGSNFYFSLPLTEEPKPVSKEKMAVAFKAGK